MTRDDIIRMAVQCQLVNAGNREGLYMDALAQFAAIVAAAKREWVGLTEQEHAELAIECGCLSADWVFYGAAVERKLKDKNT